MNKDIPATIQRHIHESFETVLDDSSIFAVYVFGSTLSGRSKQESDIDIAALLDEKSYKADLVAAIAPVYYSLECIQVPGACRRPSLAARAANSAGEAVPPSKV